MWSPPLKGGQLGSIQVTDGSNFVASPSSLITTIWLASGTMVLDVSCYLTLSEVAWALGQFS